MPQKPTFKQALAFWLKLGFISFGGPAGQIALMHEYLVEQKKWISNSKFLHALNYCMILPGPEAQQLATYIGWLLHGTWGGLAAGVLFVLPSMFILLGLSVLYVSFGSIPIVYALFTGLKPAIIAIVLLALVKIAKKSLHNGLHYLIAAVAFVCIFFFHVPFPFIVLGAIVFGVLIRVLLPNLFTSTSNTSAQNNSNTNEDDYYINSHSVIAHTAFSAPRLVTQIGVALLLWVLPFVAFYLFTPDFAFWKTLSLFFTKAALVTFGGAYAVLPYVAQVSVEQMGWLNKLQMIDGLALGETTPGPLIMVLAFVGFMAGYNHYGGSVLMGSVGLLTTTFFTFLPCFLFIFAGAPLIEKTHANKPIKQTLELVTAAVVGVVLNLCIYLGIAVIFPSGISLAAINYVSLAWIVVSVVAMYRFKIGMLTWILVSALFGALKYIVLG